jgi:hypothetical protein
MPACDATAHNRYFYGAYLDSGESCVCSEKGLSIFSMRAFGQPRFFNSEYEGAKNVVPVIGFEKSNILS